MPREGTLAIASGYFPLLYRFVPRTRQNKVVPHEDCIGYIMVVPIKSFAALGIVVEIPEFNR